MMLSPFTTLGHLTSSLTERIGQTPLVPLTGLEGIAAEVTMLGKAEWFNPGGSVKDRAAWAIVRAAEQSGALERGRRILDATSGNTGVAFAWIGATRGHPATLCLPANANAERLRLLEALGAELVLTDAMEGTDGAVRRARELAASEPQRYFYADQYSNPANWQAHYHGTAREIWEQTAGTVTHLVAGVGTAGTLVGAGRRLRELDPTIQVIAVQPDSPWHALEGLKHLPSSLRPAIFDPAVPQRTIAVGSEEAIAMARAQARRGLLLGWSAAAAVVAAARVGRELERGVVVCVLPDGAERYLSEPAWEEGA